MISKMAFKIVLILIISSFTWVHAYAEVLVLQPVSVILKKLKMDGYVSITKIELLNGEYEIQGQNSEGKQVDIKVNSHTGELISMFKKDSFMSMADAVEKIESLGYSNFSLIEAQGNAYYVVAIAPDGSKTKLNINATTGDVKRETK